jgi:hypothetical protein
VKFSFAAVETRFFFLGLRLNKNPTENFSSLIAPVRL